MSWILLLLAGICEILWAATMKYSNGFTVFLPSVITIIGYILSGVFLSAALRHLSLGTAYAAWTGLGIIGTSALGVFLFHEKLSAAQIICIMLIIIGIVGLKLLSRN